MQSIYDQLFAFLTTISIGFLAGIIFDVYRVLRGLWKPKKLGTFIGDIIFWLVMTVIVFTLLLIGNWGEIRIYVFIGVALGAYLYMGLLSRKFQRIIRSIFVLLLKIITKLWKAITWPIKMVWKIILVPVGFVLSGLSASFGFIQKRLRGIGRKLKALLPFKGKQPNDEE